jgi:hypothetical protein
MKTCTRCHLEKPLSWFKYDARSGRNHPHCVTCAAKMSIVRRGRRLCRKCDQEKPLAEFPFGHNAPTWSCQLSAFGGTTVVQWG